MVTIRPIVCPVLVGRDAFLELATHRLHAAAGGRGQILLLAGDAGIGKTRLLGSIQRRAVDADFRVASGTLAPQDQDVPAALLVDLARRMRRVPEYAATGRDLADRLAAPDIDGSTEPGRRRRLLVLDLADLLTDPGATPSFIGLEDLHWADDLSLDVLANVARHVRDIPMLIVATYRAELLRPHSGLRGWRARLLAQRQAEEIRLARLTREETAYMTSLLVAGEPLADELVTAIHERTDGIPFHIEELVGVLGDDGPSTIEAIRAAQVPDTIEETIRERFARRSEAAKEIAHVGAVIGRRFVPDVVGRIVDRPAVSFAEPLGELVDHAFLEGPGAQGEYDFRNQLLRDAIYQLIPLDERRRLHGLVAEFGAGLDGASDIHASAHFEIAGRADDAFRTAVAGARAAARISAHREALDLFRRAVRNMPADLPPMDRGGILEELAIVETARDQTAAAAESFTLARACYEAAGATLAAASVLAPLSGVRHLLGDGLAAVRPMLEAGLVTLDEAGAVGPAADRVRGRLEAALAAAFGRALDLPATGRHAARAIELATSCADTATELNALSSIAMVAPFEGRVAESIRLGTEVAERGRALHHDDEAARAYRVVASSLSEVFELETAERWMRDGIALAKRAELWNHRCYMTAHLGLILWGTGHWDVADETADAALREGRGGVTTRVTGLYVRGYVAFGRGRHGEAAAYLRESLALGERSGDILRVSLPLWGLAESALLAGDIDEAITLAERGRRVSEDVSDRALLTPFLVTGTRALLASGDTHGADRWTEDLAKRIDGTGITTLRPAIDHARGLVAFASGASGRAGSLLSAAILGWDATRRVWEASWARLDLAACLLRTRRVHEATELLADVRATAEALESRPLAEAALELQRVARGRTGYGDPWAPLTAREYEVARLIADGRTNREIAAELVISVKTAAAHVEHILAKLSATRRAEIAAWATRVRRPADAGTQPASDPNRHPR